MDLPKTQEELDALITNAIAEATKGIRADITNERKMRADAEKQIADAKAAEEAAKSAKERADLEGKGKYDEALKKSEEVYNAKLKELTAQLEAANATVRRLTVDGEILKHTANAVDPQDALALIKAGYQFDVATDGSVVVKKADGTPFLDDKGTPAGIEYTVKSFMAAKPHLVKSASNGGSGSQSGAGAAGNVDFAKMTPSERLAYAHEHSGK